MGLCFVAWVVSLSLRSDLHLSVNMANLSTSDFSMHKLADLSLGSR